MRESSYSSTVVENFSKEESLSSLFRVCFSFYESNILEAANFADDERQRKLKDHITSLTLCSEWVDQIGCFSHNESIDDVSTKDIKYLLVSYLQGEFSQRLISPIRLSLVLAAQSQLKVFCSHVEKLGLISREEASVMEQDLILDANGRRALKVARFKRQREISARLAALTNRFQDAAVEGGKSLLGNWGENMEEEEREGWLLEVRLAVDKAMDALDALQRELDMLRAAQDMEANLDDRDALQEQFRKRQVEAEQWHQSASRRAQQGLLRPSAPISCATFAQDIIEGRASAGQKHVHHKPKLGFGPVSLMGSHGGSTFREKVASQVFQPSHSLARMSIEEAGERELAIMEAVQERVQSAAMESAGSLQAQQQFEEGEGDEGSEYKARAWDDWKDENPKGSGNSKLTPCG